MSTQDAPVMGVETVLACLRKYRAHQESNILPRSGPSTIQGRQFISGLDFTPDGLVNSMFDDPARSILRLRVREIGWNVFAEAGMPGLTRLFNAVEDADQSYAGILDKWLSGIGTEEGGVWTA